MSNVNVTALVIFIVLFALVTILGFVAANWRRGDLTQLHEWGLGGRRFGTVISWFLLGGDLYTAYTFVAVPAAIFATGAINFFAVPYTIIAYPFVFVVMPRLWSVARKHGYVTPADFVRGRYDSSTLALVVALTGILATMPYIALQLVGIQVVLAGLGLSFTGKFLGMPLNDLPLVIAFIILAAYTYTSGLRAPAMIALVKDLLIYITVIVAVIVIPIQLGGYGHIFTAALQHQTAVKAAIAHPVAGVKTPSPFGVILSPPTSASLGQFGAYATLALGSALALFLYPHSVTGVLASNSRNVIKRNAALLPAYSFVLALIALLGFMAIAAGVSKDPAFAANFKQYGGTFAVPALFLHSFPAWFVGIAFAAIAIGALVPAAIMSIAAANLFTRNIYREYFRKNPGAGEEAAVAKLASLVVKFGALFFIIYLGTQNALNLQLLGGVWILQTFPTIVIGLYTRYMHRYALLIGWLAGMVTGTYMAYTQASAVTKHFGSSVFPLHLGTYTAAGYAAFYALIVNLVVSIVLSVIFNLAKVPAGKDLVAVSDFETEPAPELVGVGSEH
ncbi:MAG TPA: sodium:solute symporter [Ktedonobacterales bacterium]|jgi:SSS family solute:Na+ symporter|nr:sodium:solute symporter [Ktedonobacterales bacterium]